MQAIYKLIYNQHVNYFLRNINKLLSPVLPGKIKIPPSGMISFELNDQKILLRTNQTNYLSQLLYWEGPLKFEYTDIFLDLIKKINCFYDVGANIGYYSLLAATINPRLQAISFEPATGPLFFLKENVRINDLSNIRVESLALSDRSGEIDFYEVKNNKYTYLVLSFLINISMITR